MSNVPDNISQGLGLAKQFLEVGSGLKSLFGLKRPTPKEEKGRAQKLVEDLGEWAVEVNSQKKRWLRPVLRVAPFRETSQR